MRLPGSDTHPHPGSVPRGPYIFLVYAAYNREVSQGTLAAGGWDVGGGRQGLLAGGSATGPWRSGEGPSPDPGPILQVQSALQRMTEKKAVEAFTVGRPGVCGVGVVGGPTYGRRIPALTPFPFRLAPVPRAPGFHPRPSCSWEVARDNPVVLAPP